MCRDLDLNSTPYKHEHMAGRSLIILSFFLATLFATGGVELLYRSLGKVLTESVLPHKEVKKTSTAQGADKASPLEVQRTNQPGNDVDYTIISKRNLFGKATAITDSAVTMPKEILTTTSLDLVLLGTIGGTPGDQRAIIRDRNSGEQAIYARGDTIANALIKQINRGQIILTVNGRDEILLMEEMKSPPSTGTTQDYPMPKITLQPDRDVTADETSGTDEITATEDTSEQTEQPAPATIPKRRMTFKPTKQQVVEP